jgi:hypothetical protein
MNGIHPFGEKRVLFESMACVKRTKKPLKTAVFGGFMRKAQQTATFG